MDNIKDYIKTYPNWSVEGVDYKDTASMCNSKRFTFSKQIFLQYVLKYKAETDRIVLLTVEVLYLVEH